MAVAGYMGDGYLEDIKGDVNDSFEMANSVKLKSSNC